MPGSVFCWIPWDVFFIAGHYHDLSAKSAGSATDDHARAYASLCRGVHLDYTGQWDQALEQYTNAAALFENIGHIKKWGSTISLMAFIHHYRGEFEKSLDYARKLKEIGVESGDRQLKGWGLGVSGFLKIRMGKPEQALHDLEQSKILFESIPDYYALVLTHVDLMFCHLSMGDFNKADAAVKTAGTLVADKHIKGFVLSLYYNARCELYLTAFEMSIPLAETITLKKIKKIAARAMHCGRRFTCGLPKACLLNGRFYAIKGNLEKANDFWHQGTQTARSLGARFEEGLIFLRWAAVLMILTS